MGYSLSWMAVEGATPDYVCDGSRMQRTGKYSSHYDGPASGAILPTNWYVVVFAESSWNYPSDDILSSMSKACRIVCCNICDGIMASSIHGWVDGHQEWQVFVGDGSSKYDVSEYGEVPDAIEPIKKKLFKLQDEEGGEDCDVECVYDLPAELGLEITGFIHQYDYPELGEKPFEELIVPEPEPSEPFSSDFWLWRLLRY